VHDSDELAGSIQLEEQLSKNTAQYNKLLTEQPSNVELWLKYVQFQVFCPVVYCMNLVDTSHGISGMCFVMYSFTTHNSSIHTHIQCGRCLYTCSRELYKWLQACTGLTITCKR